MKVLKFYASWCAPCAAMKPFLEEIASSKGIQVEEVDVDTDAARELMDTHFVRSVPTLILIREDGTTKTHVGFNSKSDLDKFFE